MKENSLKMKYQVKEYTHGMMARNTKASGNRTKWTVEGYWSGLITRDMKEILRTTRGTALASSNGKTVKSIQDRGTEESSMVSVFLSSRMGNRERESGNRVSVFAGLTNYLFIL